MPTKTETKQYCMFQSQDQKYEMSELENSGDEDYEPEIIRRASVSEEEEGEENEDEPEECTEKENKQEMEEDSEEGEEGEKENGSRKA